MAYLIALIAALLGVFLNDKMSPGLRKIYLAIVGLYMVALIGFRYKVGIDTIMYMNAYRTYPSIGEILNGAHFPKVRFEPGLMWVYALCKSFTNEFWPVQMIMSAITTSTIFIFLHRYCRNVFLGVVFFIILQWLYFSVEIMRESAAVGISLVNYKNLQEKRWIRYYLFSIFSLVFHYSAIIIWLFPFVRWLKLNWIFFVLCLGAAAITPLVENLNDMLNIASITGRITMYVESTKDLTINWRLAELVKSGFPAVLTLIGFHIIRQETMFRQMLLLQILLCMGTFAIPVIFSRFTNYTSLYITVAAANLLTCDKMREWMKIVYIVLMLLSQAYYLNSMRDRWFPYVSVFNKENLPKRNNLYRHFFMPWLKNR